MERVAGGCGWFFTGYYREKGWVGARDLKLSTVYVDNCIPESSEELRTTDVATR